MDPSAGWNSLEIAKLVVSAAAPLAVVGLGVAVARASRRHEESWWANQKLIESRLRIFEEIAPKINRLLCFYTFVGRWKELTPRDVIELKRNLDEVVHVNRILFGAAVFEAYGDFMSTLFDMYGAVDRDALLRAHISIEHGDRRKLDWWSPQMGELFASSEVPTLEQVRASHDRLAEALQADLYVTRHAS